LHIQKERKKSGGSVPKSAWDNRKNTGFVRLSNFRAGTFFDIIVRIWFCLAQKLPSGKQRQFYGFLPAKTSNSAQFLSKCKNNAKQNQILIIIYIKIICICKNHTGHY
jgi:hypothetical protein